MRVFSNSFLRLCSQFKKEAKKSLQGAQCDCPACSCRATALLLMYASSCLTGVLVSMHRTHISGKYKCANLATGVGEMISVLTGVLSAVCTQELWVMRQVYQDFFLFSSCFVFPNVFLGKEIVVLSLFVLVQN